MFGKDPSDDWFDNLNPVMRLWMYENWSRDLSDKNEFARQYAILSGSFANPAMAQQMLGKDKVEYKTDDDQFDALVEHIKELNSKENIDKPRRRNRIAIG